MSQIEINAKGRCIKDGTERSYNDKNDMIGNCTVASKITGYKAEEDQTMFIKLVGFGKMATQLSRLRKGDSISPGQTDPKQLPHVALRESLSSGAHAFRWLLPP